MLTLGRNSSALYEPTERWFLVYLGPSKERQEGEHLWLHDQRDIQILHNNVNAEKRARYPPEKADGGGPETSLMINYIIIKDTYEAHPR